MTDTSTPGAGFSLDGRSFSARAPIDTHVVIGDLVLLDTPGGEVVCGQVHGKVVDNDSCVLSGQILGLLDDGGLTLGTSPPFSRATVAVAPPDVVAQLQARSSAAMPIGTSHDTISMLRAGALNRHTFMCGQSGSGKSYALGVLLEQILLETEVPLIILDPNADFVHLGDPVGDSAEHARLSAMDVTVLRPDAAEGTRPLRARFATMSTSAKAAVLRLDPLEDRAEYGALLDYAERMQSQETTRAAMEELLAAPGAAERALAERLKNLGVLGWSVWADDKPSAIELIRERPRAAVLDLSGFAHPQERLVVALDLLEHLWSAREQRQPTILVIDEAHNVCSANPTTALEIETTERLIQIASEGRKYGIWLLLCTQRPSRIHPSVLSQCDNVVLMRMNSRGDLEQLKEVFGFAPASMVASAPFFRQGECLMAGGFIPVPTFVTIAARRTRQGGSDVSVPLTAPAGGR